MGAGTSSSSPIVVCDRVPEDSIEPCDCALVIANLGTVFDSLQVRRLEDVLGSRPCLQRGLTESSETSYAEL